MGNVSENPIGPLIYGSTQFHIYVYPPTNCKIHSTHAHVCCHAVIFIHVYVVCYR